MKFNPTPNLLFAGLIISQMVYAETEVTLETAFINDSGEMVLNYDFTDAGAGSTCLAIVKINRIQDSIDFDSPATVPAIGLGTFLWDAYDANYTSDLESLPKKDTIEFECKNLDGGSSSNAGETSYHSLFAKKKKGYLEDNPTHTVTLNETILSAYGWDASGVARFTSFDNDNYDYTVIDENDNYAVIDDSLVITTAILRRDNGKTKQYYHFQSWVDLETGTVTNIPIGMDEEHWHYPGYDSSFPVTLPALISFNAQNQPGCLAQLNSSNKYECIWPSSEDRKDIFPVISAGDISITENYRVLSCGEAESDGIELPSGAYDVVSLETQDGVTGHHTIAHWCSRADKTYRTWNNLTSSTGQGWVAAKDGMGNWWCLRDTNWNCKNSLLQDISIPDESNLADKMNILVGRMDPMADFNLVSCLFNDESVSSCSDNDDNAFDNDVTLDSLKKAYYIDAANLLDSEEP